MGIEMGTFLLVVFVMLCVQIAIKSLQVGMDIMPKAPTRGILTVMLLQNIGFAGWTAGFCGGNDAFQRLRDL